MAYLQDLWFLYTNFTASRNFRLSLIHCLLVQLTIAFCLGKGRESDYLDPKLFSITERDAKWVYERSSSQNAPKLQEASSSVTSSLGNGDSESDEEGNENADDMDSDKQVVSKNGKKDSDDDNKPPKRQMM